MHNKLTALTLILFISFQSLGLSQERNVVAQKGDGIYSLLRKNGLDPTKYVQQFIHLNKESLKTDHHLIVGKSYLLPLPEVIIEEPKSVVTDSISKKPMDSLTIGKIDYPLFGEEHRYFQQESTILDDAIYYLISGHGGPDPGALAKYGNTIISEDEYAYDVTLRLAQSLLANGATVYIIIKDENDGIRDRSILEVDYDEVCYLKKRIPLNQTLRLRQRTRAVNTLYIKHKGAYQRLIVTHVDSRQNANENIDVFFYHHKSSQSGKQLATNIYESFKEKYAEHQPNREYAGSVNTRSLYLIKNTFPPMVYIELGNIQNKKDQKRILDYNNRQALANWIFTGLVKDFELSKKLTP